MKDLEELKGLEKTIDDSVRAITLLTRPIRVPLTAFGNAIFDLVHGTVTPATPDAVSRGLSLIARIANLIPILKDCPANPLGTSALDAVRALHTADPSGEQLRRLGAYAHFCELMPQIHRGYYTVERVGSTFRIDFAQAGFAATEAEDFLLSELAADRGGNKLAEPHSALRPGLK
jgi:hypothetical protein